MINFFIQTHKDFFLWMHSFVLNYPEYHAATYFIAEKLDHYVIALSMVTMLYFIYQSFENTSLTRLRFMIRELVRILVSVCASWLFSFVIKITLNMPRPYVRFADEVTQLFDYASGMRSFPSGHATLFMALAVMIGLHHKRAGYIFLFFAVLISIARVVSGIHFPVDIAAGWVIGAGVSYLVYRKIGKNK
ncbi:MAG: phosphatase PAP2 family protein [Minisyncoccia bacterium]